MCYWQKDKIKQKVIDDEIIDTITKAINDPKSIKNVSASILNTILICSERGILGNRKLLEDNFETDKLNNALNLIDNEYVERKNDFYRKQLNK